MARLTSAPVREPLNLSGIRISLIGRGLVAALFEKIMKKQQTKGVPGHKKGISSYFWDEQTAMP
jgi:hypothetical protein